MIRDVCALCRVRDTRLSTPALPTSTAAARTTPAPRAAQGRERSRSPEPERETAADRARRSASVVPGAKDAGRAVSMGYRPSEPYFYYKPEFTDQGLTKFLSSKIEFQKYEGHETGIRKLAEQLANVKLDGDVGYTCTFDNGFEVLGRSRYLIGKYGAYMYDGKYVIDTDAKREIFVVAEIEDVCFHDAAQTGPWLEYLHLFGTGDLGSAKVRFARETTVSAEFSGSSPNSSPPPRGEDGKPSDASMVDPQDVGFRFKVGGKEVDSVKDAEGPDVPASPTSSTSSKIARERERKESRAVNKSSIGGVKKGIASVQSAKGTQQKANVDKVIERIIAKRKIQKKELPKAEPATALTIDEQRELLYDEDQVIRGRWKQYSGQITTLAGHLEVLLEDDNQLFPLVGQDSVVEILQKNDYTGVLYRYVEEYRNDYANDYQLLFDRFKFKILADEYVIIHAMDEHVQEIEDEGDDKDWCIDLQYWIRFLSKMEKNVTDKAALSRMNLGSELHTFPADASLDLMQNLTRRLEALQEW